MNIRIYVIILITLFTVSIANSRQIERPEAKQNQNALSGITIEKDIEYSHVNGKKLLLDIAYPTKESSKPRPIIVWIHGGAWRAGSKDHNRAIPFCKEGYFTASINYRLSQEAIWPAQIHDCKAAIRFLRAHAGKYNINPDKIGVWGSSAGGHLVAMLGTSGDVEQLEGQGGWQDQSSRVQAVVDFFGPSDFIKMCDKPSHMDHGAPGSPESQLIGGVVKQHPDRVRSVDPTTYASKDDPPFLIFHGDQDMTVPYNQSEIMHDALQKAGVDVKFITVKGGKHGGWNDKTTPTNREIIDKVKEFFAAHLKK